MLPPLPQPQFIFKKFNRSVNYYMEDFWSLISQAEGFSYLCKCVILSLLIHFILFAVVIFIMIFHTSEAILVADRICRLIFHLNNVINPLIYYWKMSDTRKNINELLICRKSNTVLPEGTLNTHSRKIETMKSS